MKKVVIRTAGSYDRLRFEELPDPSPRPDELVIDVRAIGINYADVIVRMGLYSSAREFVGWPITPGFEVSGVVERCGERVEAFKPGDEVVAVTLFGGYATKLCVNEVYVFPKPVSLSYAQAASLPAVFMTAWFALKELAHPRPGAKILVHSAAGGVGSSLVQVAKIMGCQVVGVVGASHKVEVATALGADFVIDKSKRNLWREAKARAPGGYDVVCDANGVATLRESYEHLRRAGKLVIYGFHTMLPKKGGKPKWPKLALGWLRTPRFNPLDLTNDSKSVLAFNLSYLFDRTDLLKRFVSDLRQWIEEGEIQAPPVTEYAFEDVAGAHADIESGMTVGKLVLVPRAGGEAE
jgi:NADPH:quinone reductase-like Zn-dependent oxidoreductase